MDTSQTGVYEYRFSELGDYNYDHNPTPVVVEQRVNARPSARFKSPGDTYKFCLKDGDADVVIPMVFSGLPPFQVDVEIRHRSLAKSETLSLPGISDYSYDLRIPHRYLHLGHSTLVVRRIRDAHGCQSHSQFDSPGRSVQISVHSPPQILPLEDWKDLCVGDWLSFALIGTAPFNVVWKIEGKERKRTEKSTFLRLLADKPGLFDVTGLSDSASNCQANFSSDNMGSSFRRQIHPLPSVRMSGGRVSIVDIPEGGEADTLLEFQGTPPFEFTYTRSTNAEKGKDQIILETHAGHSMEYRKRITTNEKGTYEVTSIKDAYCSYPKEASSARSEDTGKLLKD